MKNNDETEAVLQELAEEAMITRGGCLGLRPGRVYGTAVSPSPDTSPGSYSLSPPWVRLPGHSPAPGGLAPPRKGYRPNSDAVGGAYRAAAAFERRHLRLTLLNAADRRNGKNDSKGVGSAFRV